MNKKSIMREFINIINNECLMTKFIKNIFDYEEIYDYNYLFRMIEYEDEVIIDIYDNVSDNRFNRYIFSFGNCDYTVKVVEDKNVFVNYISVFNVIPNNDKLLKLAYLFKLDNDEMLEYAKSFLDIEFVLILKRILKKPT